MKLIFFLFVILSSPVFADRPVVIVDYIDGYVDLDMSENTLSELSDDLHLIPHDYPEKRFESFNIISLFPQTVFKISENPKFKIFQKEGSYIDYLFLLFTSYVDDVLLIDPFYKFDKIKEILDFSYSKDIIIYCSTYKYSLPIYRKIEKDYPNKAFTYVIYDSFLNLAIPLLQTSKLNKNANVSSFISIYDLQGLSQGNDLIIEKIKKIRPELDEADILQILNKYYQR